MYNAQFRLYFVHCIIDTCYFEFNIHFSIENTSSMYRSDDTLPLNPHCSSIVLLSNWAGIVFISCRGCDLLLSYILIKRAAVQSGPHDKGLIVNGVQHSRSIIQLSRFHYFIINMRYRFDIVYL